MVKTSTARSNNYICPECKGELSQDHSNCGYVRHKSNPNCLFERGQKDESVEKIRKDKTRWHITTNNDNGSLKTGNVKLEVGQVIEILGEDRDRTVTYVMGSERNGWHACFKDQGAVPVGDLEWRIIKPKATKRHKWFDYHTVKGIAEFIGVVIGIIATLVTFITWLVT